MAHSVLNQLDARSKILLTVLGAISTIAFSTLGAQLVLFGVSFVMVLLINRPMLVFVLYLLMGAMMLLASACTWVMASFIPSLGEITFASLVIPFLRGLTMMNCVMSMALTTKIENIMSALTQLRLPFILTLPATVMIRFISTFTHDVAQVWETLKIRGWEMGFTFFLRHPYLSTRLLFTPLLFRALKSSEALGVAAELKGLDRGLQQKGAMNFHGQSAFSKADAWLFLGASFTVVMAIYIELHWIEWGLNVTRFGVM